MDVAELLVGELVANAVLHTGAPARLLVTYDGAVRVEVTDASARPPVLLPAGLDDTAGRGLRLVDALASGWGWQPGEDGKTVWAELG